MTARPYTKVVDCCTYRAGAHPHWQWARHVRASSLAPMDKQPIRDDPPVQGQPRILVVDDNEDAAATLSVLLQMMGYLAHTAHNGREAVRAAKQDRYDLILLDLNMPVMDGFQAAIELAKLRPAPRLIACSAQDDLDTRRRTSELGFCAHLTKPVEFQLLEDTLKRNCYAEHDCLPVE